MWPDIPLYNVHPDFVVYIDCKRHGHAFLEDIKTGVWVSCESDSWRHVFRIIVLEPFLFGKKYSLPVLTDWAIFAGLLPKFGYLRGPEINETIKSNITLLDSVAFSVYHMLDTVISLSANCDHGRNLLGMFKKRFEALKSCKSLNEACSEIQTDEFYKIIRSCVPDSVNTEKLVISYAICFMIFFSQKDTASVCSVIQPLTPEEEQWKIQGNSDHNNKDYESAIAYYTKAVQSNQFNHIIYCNRAISYLKLTMNLKAEMDAFRAVVMSPTWCKGYFRLATALEAKKEYHTAHHVASWGLSACEKNGYCNDFNSLTEMTNRLKVSCLEGDVCSKKIQPALKESTASATVVGVPDLLSDSDPEPENREPAKPEQDKAEKDSKIQTQSSMPNLLHLINEQQSHCKSGSMLIIANKSLEAIPFYEKALEIIPLFHQQNYDIEPAKLLTLKYSLGIAHLEGDNENLKKALILFEEIYNMSAKTFLAVYYGLSSTFVKLFRFDDAMRKIGDGLEVAEQMNLGVFSTYSWPGTETVIEHTIPERLKGALSELSQLCKVPPDASCRFDFCTLGKKIYFGSPDYKGHYQVDCTESCRLQFHLQCWKQLSQNMKLSEKEFLNHHCLTPDCGNDIVSVIKINKNGDIEKSFMKDETKNTKASKHRKTKMERKMEQKEIRKSKKREEKVPRVSESEVPDDLEVKTEFQLNEALGSTNQVESAEKASQPTTAEAGRSEKSSEVDIALKYDVNSEPLYVIKKGEGETSEIPTPEINQRKKNKKKKSKNVMSVEEFCGDALAERGNLYTQRVNRLQEQKTLVEKGMNASEYLNQPALFSRMDTGDHSPFRIPHDLDDIEQLEIALQSFPRLGGINLDDKVIANTYSFFEDIIGSSGPAQLSSLTDYLIDFPPEAKSIIEACGGVINFLLHNNKFRKIDNYICMARDVQKACILSRNNPVTRRGNLDTIDNFHTDTEDDSVTYSYSDTETSDDENDSDADVENDINKTNTSSLPQKLKSVVHCVTPDSNTVPSSLPQKLKNIIQHATPDVFNVDKHSSNNYIAANKDSVSSFINSSSSAKTMQGPSSSSAPITLRKPKNVDNDKLNVASGNEPVDKNTVKAPDNPDSDRKVLFEADRSKKVMDIVCKPVSAMKNHMKPAMFQMLIGVSALPEDDQVELISAMLNSLSKQPPAFWSSLNTKLSGMCVKTNEEKSARADKPNTESIEMLAKNRDLEEKLTSSFDKIARLRVASNTEKKLLEDKIAELKHSLEANLNTSKETKAAHEVERKRWQQEKIKLQEGVKREKDEAATAIKLLNKAGQELEKLEKGLEDASDMKNQYCDDLDRALDKMSTFAERAQESETKLLQTLLNHNLEAIDKALNSLYSLAKSKPAIMSEGPQIQKLINDYLEARKKYENEMNQLLKRVSEGERIDLDSIPKVDLSKQLSSGLLANQSAGSSSPTSVPNPAAQLPLWSYLPMNPLNPKDSNVLPSQPPLLPHPPFTAFGPLFGNPKPVFSSGPKIPNSASMSHPNPIGNNLIDPTLCASAHVPTPNMFLGRPMHPSLLHVTRTSLSSNNTKFTSLNNQQPQTIKKPISLGSSSYDSLEPIALNKDVINPPMPVSRADQTAAKPPNQAPAKPPNQAPAKPPNQAPARTRSIPIVEPPSQATVKPPTQATAKPSQPAPKPTAAAAQNNMVKLPLPPSKAGNIVPKPGSFDKLKQSTKKLFPSLSDNEIEAYIKRYRSQKQKLTGMSIEQIVEGISALIRSEKPMIAKGKSKSSMGLDNIQSGKKWAQLQEPNNWNSEVADGDCPICLEFIHQDKTFQAECRHIFHIICINSWMKTNSTCPVCRKHILLPDEFPALY